MSQIEHVKGKLFPLYPELSLNAAARKTLVDYGIDFDHTLDGQELMDIFHDRMYGKNVVTLDLKLYKSEAKDISTQEFYMARRNNDGTIDFDVMYSNGGYSLDDAIYKGLELLDAREPEKRIFNCDHRYNITTKICENCGDPQPEEIAVDFKIFLEVNSWMGGTTIDVYDVGAENAFINWDGIVHEWLKDDDVREIVLTSPNIGYTKRLQKVPLDWDIEEFKKSQEVAQPAPEPLSISVPMHIVDELIKVLVNARSNAQTLNETNDRIMERTGINRVTQLVGKMYYTDEADSDRLKLYLLDRRGTFDDIPRFVGGMDWAYDMSGNKVDAITNEPLSPERLAEVERDSQ